MKRANSGFGLRAVIVESLGAMVLLYLLFPLADHPTPSETGSSATVASEAASSESVGARPVPSKSAVNAEESFRRLPTLHVPAPPARELLPPPATKRVAAMAHVESERRDFVARELEYSRRALAVMLQQHWQQLVEPFGESE